MCYNKNIKENKMRELKLPGIEGHELKKGFSKRPVYTQEELEAMQKVEEELRKNRLLKRAPKKKRGPICRQSNTGLVNVEEQELGM